MSFRFFINVDQCLNMNNFDFFFYRERSDHKLYMISDAYLGEGVGKSFKKAAGEVRLYLDRFPYNVRDYQIIVTMRSEYGHESRTWKDTLLSRLLDIDRDLKQSRISTRAGFYTQVAINLIMVYEAGEIKTIHELDDEYMSSKRLQEDLRLLMKEIGVDEGQENNITALKSALEKYRSSHDEKGDTGAVSEFFDELIKKYESDSKHQDDIQILGSLKEILEDYQIFELIGDKQDRNSDINALLRIVEFSVTDFEIPHGMEKSVTLSELCRNHWNSIKKMNDSEIQEKYSKMLYHYRERLREYVELEEAGGGSRVMESALPTYNKPSDEEISVAGSEFEKKISVGNENNNSMKGSLERFRSKITPSANLSDEWDNVYEGIKQTLGELDRELSSYSDKLGDVYKENLEKRKAEEEVWHNKCFVSDKDTPEQIKKLQRDEEQLLDMLNQPQMTPSLQFQDQLNMAKALEEGNADISHYISCINSVSVRNFILLILVLVGVSGVFYALLQTYDFKSPVMMLIFVSYIAAAAVIMFFSWKIPVSYYRKKMNSTLDSLIGEMDKYIVGYMERAKQLKNYINLMNQLDYLERHLRLKTQAVTTSEWLKAAHLWHIGQAKNHLNKLEFFSGLISLYDPDTDKSTDDNSGTSRSPKISSQFVDDVVDSRLYWPQI